MKKITALAVLLVFLMFIGCSQTPQTETVPEYNIDSEETEINLDGMQFFIATNWTDEYLPEPGYSADGDKILKRYADVENELNITISVDQVSEAPDYLLRDVAAGLHSHDLIDQNTNYLMTLYNGGFIFPLDEISTIDISQTYKYAPENFRRFGIIDGNSYGFFPWAWEATPQFEGVILFNNEHVLRYGFQNPYEMQENGTWTWDGFKTELENIKAIAGADGISPLIRNGVARMTKTAILSNGVPIVTEENGKFTFNLDNEKAYKALEYVRELESEDLMMYGDAPEFAVNAQGVYMSCASWKGTLHAATKPDLPSYLLNDYGMLPFPLGPDAPEGTCSAYMHMGKRLFVIASMSFNDPEEIGIVVDRIFEPLDGDEINLDQPAWKEYAERLIFHHPEGYANFEFMIDNVTYDYSMELRMANTKIEDAFSRVFDGKETAASAIASIKDAAQQCLDDIYAGD